MSTGLISDASSTPKVDRCYFASKRMIVSRAISLIFPLVQVALLATTLGLNNSSSALELPENAATCNETDDLYLYSSDFLTRSINIFCGIWLGFCCLAVIYQIIILLITFVKNADINYRLLLRFDIGLNSFFMWIFIDGAAGAFLMGFLWSAYNGAIDIEGGAASIPVAIVALQYISFVLYIICMSHYYSVVMNTSIYCSSSCTKGCGTKTCATMGLKDMVKDPEEEA